MKNVLLRPLYRCGITMGPESDVLQRLYANSPRGMPLRLAKKLLAHHPGRVLSHCTLPRSLFVPERMLMLTRPPELCPVRASNELVWIRTSPTASSGGT